VYKLSFVFEYQTRGSNEWMVVLRTKCKSKRIIGPLPQQGALSQSSDIFRHNQPQLDSQGQYINHDFNMHISGLRDRQLCEDLCKDSTSGVNLGRLAVHRTANPP
jgi:hypothetical protein